MRTPPPVAGRRRLSSAALSARGLTVRFGAISALEDVDVEIPSGKRVALLGPNGAGKSTLFAAAVGLIGPTEGSIALASDRVAFVPQRREVEPLFPATVEDVVRMGRYGDLGPWRRFRARDRELVATGLALLEIEHLAQRRFTDLSGGERQRACSPRRQHRIRTSSCSTSRSQELTPPPATPCTSCSRGGGTMAGR